MLGNSLPLTGYGLRFWVMTDTTMINRLKQFVESEMRSCSMDIGGITPLYVYRMWGGSVAIDEIATGLTELRIIGCMAYGNPNLRNRVNVKIEFS